MISKVALITGITGQDGSYLARFLLGKGYVVHGLVRWDAVEGTERISDILGPPLPKEGGGETSHVVLHHGDLSDANCVTALVKALAPDEIYNLAALSHVGVSFVTPGSVLDINAKGSLNIFEAVRICGFESKTRIYQASSSEMFGAAGAPQNEETVMRPCSPYGVAKLAAYHLARIYRDSYGMFIANGILFNHESPMRGGDFVTQKIVQGAVAVRDGRLDVLRLGNLEALRDWGHARDYVRGMWMMVQHEVADDFVLASGEARSVRDFAVGVFARLGMNLEWRGEGVDEIGVDAVSGQVLVRIDPTLFRPKEVDHLCGDAAKAREVLGWEPEISFEGLIGEMVEAACKDEVLNSRVA